MSVSGISGYSGLSYTSSYGSLSNSGAVKPPSEEDMKDKVASYLAGLDTDGNGTVNLEESGVSQDSFNQVDTDGDGEISQEELMSYLKENRPPPPPGGMGGAGGAGGGQGASGTQSSSSTDAADTNGDGVVSAEEMMAYMMSQLQAYLGTSGTTNSDSDSTSDSLASLLTGSTGTTASGALSGATNSQAMNAYNKQQNDLVKGFFDFMKSQSDSDGVDLTV